MSREASVTFCLSPGDKHFAHTGGRGKHILHTRGRGGSNIFHTQGGANIFHTQGGTNIFTLRGGQTFYDGGGGTYGDVVEELVVSEARRALKF